MSHERSTTERWFRRVVKLLLAAVLVVGTWWFWPQTVVEVKTVAVQRGAVELIVPSVQAGNVKSARQVGLRPVIAGRVSRIHVKRGDRVAAGAALVELESESMDARVRLSRANLLVGQSAQRAAEIRREAARKLLERNRKLAEKGMLAEGGMERFETEFQASGEAVASAEANLVQLKAALDVAASAVEETRIRAPFAGLVAEVHAELGDTASPAAPLLELVDDSSLRVEASIDEADAGKLTLGQAVRVVTDAFPGEPFEGKLVYISPLVLRDLRQNRQLNVEVELDAAAARLKVGMSADLEIVVERHEDVLFVHTSAVMRLADSHRVYAVRGGRARLVTFVAGVGNWERTEVMSGLQEGERVVLNLEQPGLADGVRVRLAGALGPAEAAY
jgi:HlyD family secretion protein